ncbi:MAG TPA: type IV toxin-antitoxin system AbiEi family antitoxin domain-containing protein [Solirubrobacteraceae bacterium]|nr:type IV toxin-antitoxin system AbiEi family antitoxin domain-containing protein [Solirubrobacteraceae bacterium]
MASQHGVLSLAQLQDLGLSTSGVGKRVAAGRLHRVHHGVYSVIDPMLLTRPGRFMAAVLACGASAALSHRCAAAQHELRLGVRALVDVTTPHGKSRPGIRVHSAATLLPSDIILIDSIPTTTLARTLLDVAEDATRRELERAIDAAEQQRILDMSAIDDALSRANGRHGQATLQAVLREHKLGNTLTRNELEEAFLQICRHAGTPPDQANAWIPFPDGGGAAADFLWGARCLVIEVDGRDVHTTRSAFESDRRRDQRLATLGYRVVRFTWRQVMFAPGEVAGTLRALL